MDYKTFLGVSAMAVGFVGYIPYLIHIFKGITKPHAFSWLVWSILTGIAFFAQIVEGGGAGAWSTGSSSLLCFIVFILALFKGVKRFTTLDWASLFAALLAIVLWKLTEEPLLAVILVTLADALGFIPTFKKGYENPYEETASLYTFSSLKFLIAIFAFDLFTLSVWLYPVSLIVMNGAFALMLVVRRNQLRK